MSFSHLVEPPLIQREPLSLSKFYLINYHLYAALWRFIVWILCRWSTVPSDLTTSSTLTRPTRCEARKIQRAAKRTAEVEKMKSDLKKPTAFQLNSKKDRKVMNNQVKLTQTTVALKKRNNISYHLEIYVLLLLIYCSCFTFVIN